jgi:anti-sigma regulatory factor (Ser/Thr protein kinase)
MMVALSELVKNAIRFAKRELNRPMDMIECVSDEGARRWKGAEQQ